MKLTGPPPGPSMGGIYTAPYTATINGVSTFVICDDFQTDVFMGQEWDASVMKVSDLQGSTASQAVKFDRNATAAKQQADYTTAAYLATQIMATDQSTEAGRLMAGWLSYALWGLFDPPAFNAISGNNRTQAEQQLQLAIAATANQSTSNYANVYIYTPTPLTASQEYLVVSMAEPPSIAVLSLDLLAIAGLVFFVRKRMMQTSQALS